MTAKNPTIWSLLEHCVRQLDEPFRRSEIVGWFRRHHPEVNESSLAVHIQAATANAPQPIAGFAGRTPLLVRIDRGQYTRFRSPDAKVDESRPVEAGRRVVPDLSLREAVGAARAALIIAAHRRSTVTVAELVDALDEHHVRHGIGLILERVRHDCERRGEPDLASLVTRTTRPAEAVNRAAQEECYARWA